MNEPNPPEVDTLWLLSEQIQCLIGDLRDCAVATVRRLLAEREALKAKNTQLAETTLGEMTKAAAIEQLMQKRPTREQALRAMAAFAGVWSGHISWTEFERANAENCLDAAMRGEDRE